MCCYNNKGLEWITDTKVQRHVLPLEVVDPSLTYGVTRVMELKTEVDTKDNKRGVDTQAKTCVEAELLVEVVEVEYLLGVAILRVA